MMNTPKDTTDNAMVSVTCTHPQCGETFSVSSAELTRARDLTCPFCKKKFTPIFTEGIGQK